MYDVKTLIEKMKTIANIKSNIELASLLNVSYNTLNTWIKRHKLPQEVLIDFCNQYSCSLDFLVLNQNSTTTSPSPTAASATIKKQVATTKEESAIDTFTFWGSYKELNIKPGDTIELSKSTMHSLAYYLLYKESIYCICQVFINPFKHLATLIDYDTTLTIEEFNTINLGLIHLVTLSQNK